MARDRTAREKEKEAKQSGKFVARTGRLRKYFKEVGAELRKVTWPTREKWIKYTGVVMIFVAIFSVIVGVMDYGLASILQLITG